MFERKNDGGGAGCICDLCLKRNVCTKYRLLENNDCDKFVGISSMPPVKPAKQENAVFHVDFEPVGILRTMDDLGRVAIPKEFRKFIGINSGDTVEVFVNKNGDIFIRKYEDGEDNG